MFPVIGQVKVRDGTCQTGHRQIFCGSAWNDNAELAAPAFDHRQVTIDASGQHELAISVLRANVSDLHEMSGRMYPLSPSRSPDLSGLEWLRYVRSLGHFVS